MTLADQLRALADQVETEELEREAGLLNDWLGQHRPELCRLRDTVGQEAQMAYEAWGEDHPVTRHLSQARAALAQVATDADYPEWVALAVIRRFSHVL